MPESPRTPRGLKAAGKSLWCDVTEIYGLKPDDLRVLEAASRTADTVARLEAALVGAPLTVRGSMGQEREHPLLAEVRQQRALLARLLKQLNLSNDAAKEAEHASARSARATVAARARWGVAGRGVASGS